MHVRRLLVCAALTALAAGGTGGSAWAASPTAQEASGHYGPSNLGVCSPYLAGLPDPLGEFGNVRPRINALIRTGVFEVETVGELYSVRARQHRNLPPAQECLKRQ